MKLENLLIGLDVSEITGTPEGRVITGIEYDSRKVKKDSLFIAIKGYTADGHNFIPAAVKNGASVIVYEKNGFVDSTILSDENIVKVVVDNSRKAFADISNKFYGQPTEKLNLIGITGTKGKTTTSYYVKKILETAGFKTGLVGTIANYIGSRQIYTTLTTPEASDLNNLFNDMLNEGCTHAVMEVSSHSLVLHRVSGLNFRGAIFTNITSDHLDFHLNFEEYLKAKKILFDVLTHEAFIVYNADDNNSGSLLADTQAKKYSYGTKPDANFRLENINYNLDGTRFDLVYDKNKYGIKTRLVGEFNAYNAAAAFAVCLLSGIEADKAVEGIATTPQVPGRFETIHHKNRKVIIDYSHTADSIEKALLAIHNIVKGERSIYTVFGCGGNRDKSKRPVMGEIASSLSDKVYVTSDNPRFEEPMDIIKDILKGISKNNFEVIENREDAIKQAIEKSEDNSVILIAGKGHETYQEIKGIRNHFSDKETAEKYLA